MPITLRHFAIACLTAAPLWLGGCEQLGIESPAEVAAKREAEGKAVGAGCRHAARSVEACYSLNKRADKAAIFAGWREMNDYMRENKIDAMPAPAPTMAAPAADGEAEVAAAAEQDETPAAKPAKTAKASSKH